MDWQNIVATAIVAVAAASLGLRVWRTVKSGLNGETTGNCQNCARNPEVTNHTPVIPWEQLGRK